jgi:ubiquinone/menaquinone biosynthesis C-methylase UbiE
MDVASLSFPDASFDLVLCSHVLNEVTDRPRAIRELVRVLRTPGLAILLGVASVEEARAELDRAGFEVAVRGLRTGLDPELADSSGIFPDEPLFFCRKPSG